ncbi:neprilysin-2-like [Dermacentor andersoni]|uniref:neprilysin-2-like n=1 Tax=Dermacentor andersoni TaxID=34620 RepID=UPI0024166FE2|nr:neprilysin-2-like [Dermacentor andersoni]
MISCLQSQHAKMSKTDSLDRQASENMADFAGSLVSHAAFRELPEHQRCVTVPGGGSALNLTGEQLYFVSRCVMWSTDSVWRDYSGGNHAAYRARCDVPAMNLPGFGEAFNCAPGSRMNPVDKCAF